MWEVEGGGPGESSAAPAVTAELEAGGASKGRMGMLAACPVVPDGVFLLLSASMLPLLLLLPPLGLWSASALLLLLLVTAALAASPPSLLLLLLAPPPVLLLLLPLLLTCVAGFQSSGSTLMYRGSSTLYWSRGRDR